MPANRLRDEETLFSLSTERQKSDLPLFSLMRFRSEEGQEGCAKLHCFGSLYEEETAKVPCKEEFCDARTQGTTRITEL